MHVSRPLATWLRLLGVAVLTASAAVSLPTGAGASPPGESVAAYWTRARIDAAIPRDLVVDDRGQGYLRRPDGTLQPHGVAAARPAVKPSNPGGGNGGGGGGGGSDTTPPSISAMDPAGGTVTTPTYEFAAHVSDASGVKSVTFHLQAPGASTTTAHAASLTAGTSQDGTWSATLPLTDGSWAWHVEARDTTRRGGLTATSTSVSFAVSLPPGDGPGDPGTGEVVTNQPWTGGGTVQTAAGRIYFEMPTNGPNWGGYVCSGTVATDEASNRSIVITAAHCVYDEVTGTFARNVMFIPDQAGTSGSGTDRNCGNDPLGCWAPTHGVVDADWANRSWPDNIPWDYGYYVVPTEGAHAGTTAASSLEVAAGSLPVQFAAATQGAFTHALGYSYSDDPDFMYCAEDLGIDSSYGSLWLGQCGLSGGASGGPWMQPVDGGNGPIIGVNSYGYSTRDGMGAAHLTGSARCMLAEAETAATPSSTVRGIVSSC